MSQRPPYPIVEQGRLYTAGMATQQDMDTWWAYWMWAYMEHQVVLPPEILPAMLMANPHITPPAHFQR